MKNGFQNILKNYRVVFIALSLVGLNTGITEAGTINVSALNTLQNAVNNSSPGDIINLANGHYTNCNLTITKSNITVQAATAGGVYLDGTSVITINGNNNTFGGFQFTANVTANGTNTIAVNGNTNTITQLNFNGYCADHFLYITGQYNVVSNSNFQNKTAIMTPKAGTGDMVQIIPNATNPGYNTIRYCSFQHLPGMGGDYGNECIRIGNSTLSTYISRTVIEFCYFEDTGLGDSETISVKSRENVIRYNTMNNNPDAMFCFRNGDNNVAYGNFFINSGGLRVKEANNIFCYNNYFEKSGLTGSMNAVTYIYDTSNSTYVLDNINFFHNTFVNCGMIDFGGIGATNGTWANNIFSKSGNIFQNTNAGTTFKGNIYTGTLGISIPSGMTNTDPKLALNTEGYYGLTALSPGINSANTTYPKLLTIPSIDTLLLDIQGKTRPTLRAQRDVGCEEYNATGTSINRPLKLSETGPTYLRSLTTTINPVDDNPELMILSSQTTRQMNVTYTLERETQVNLEIFNLSGQLIKSYINNQKKMAGPHSQSFDIMSLTSGIFFARLSINANSKTVKFIVGK